MKRFLLGVIVIAIVAVFGGNLYYSHLLKKQLNQMASTLQMMGGDLEYSGVSINLEGDVQVHDLSIFAPGFGERMNIDRIVLRTGSIIGVHRLAADFRNNRLPEQLGLSIEGARMPTGGENYRQLDALSAQGGQSVSVAGCGKRQHFNAQDLINMGYTELVMDTHMDYRMLDRTGVIEMSSRVLTHDMHNLSMAIEMSLGTVSRNISAVGMAMAGAALQSMTIEYEDLGYADRALTFCQKETDMGRQAFIEHHLEAWQDAWQAKGFMAGTNMVSAYQRFLERPGQIGLNVSPATPFSMMQLAAIPPELLIYQLQAELWVNRSAAGRLDISVMDEKAIAERRERRREATRASGDELTMIMEGSETETPERALKPTPQVEAPSPEGRRPVAVADLHRHQGAYVELRLANGRRLEGRIEETGSQYLRLKQFQSGGHFVRPVAYTDITSAYLTTQ